VSAVLRSWLGFLALGAGLVHVALVIGSPPVVAVMLLLIGAAEFAWGAVTIARPTPPLARFALAAAFVPVVGWALLLVVAGADSLGPLTSSRQLLPMLVASLFDLLVAGGLAAIVRHAPANRAEPDATSAPLPAAPVAHPGRRLVAVIVGGLVIAALTAPALAATEAGQYVGPGNSVFDTGHDH
jgi:hypothetical protein